MYIYLGKLLKAAVFILILVLVLITAFFYAQATLIERKTSVFPVFPRKLNQTNNQMLFTDNKTRIYYFYCYCTDCPEEPIRSKFYQRLPNWVLNISYDAYEAEIYNTMRRGEDVAENVFFAVGLPESEITSDTLDRLIILNNFEGFIFSLGTEDDAIRAAVTYLVKGGVALVQDANTSDQRNDILNLPLPTIFILGLSQGFTACLIALISFIVATTQQLGRGFARALKRAMVITLSVFYVYLLLGFLFVSSFHIIYYVSRLTMPMALLLTVIGILYFAEVTRDLYTGGWRKGEEARIPLFKTPQTVKKFIQKTAFHDSLYFDFAIGALFSFIKLLCIAPLFLTLIVAVPSQPSAALTSIITFNLGAVLPILILGSLASIGFLKIGQLSEIRFKGRIVQRFLVGASLIVSAAFILYL